MNYAEPGSGDEFPDAGEIDSDDSDFVASGGTRTAVRAARLSSKAPVGASVFRAGASTPTITVRAATPQQQKQNELDQSYLGMIPPSRFITAKPVAPTKHEYLYVPSLCSTYMDRRIQPALPTPWMSRRGNRQHWCPYELSLRQIRIEYEIASCGICMRTSSNPRRSRGRFARIWTYLRTRGQT